MKLNPVIAALGTIFVMVLLACVHVHYAEAQANPLTSQFKVSDIVKSISSSEFGHIIDTRKDAKFISLSFKGQPAYLVRYPDGRLTWMAQAELKLSQKK